MYRFTLPPVAVTFADGKISVREIAPPPPPRPATVHELLTRRKQVEQMTTGIVRDVKTGERSDLRAIDIEIEKLIAKGGK